MRQIIFNIIILSIFMAQPVYAQGVSGGIIDKDNILIEISATQLATFTQVSNTVTGQVINHEDNFAIFIQDITLNKGGTISGQVIDTSGNPVVAARMWVRDEECQSQGHSYTDSNGKYIIDNLLPDRNYCLEIYPPADMNLIKQRMENILIKSGTITVVNVCLLSGGIITGTITDIAGNPVEQAMVMSQVDYVYSDSNGQYIINGLPTGIYTIRAIPPSDNHDLASLIIKNIKVTQDSITVQNLILPIAGTLTGYIKDTMGNPVADALIYIYTDCSTGTQSQSDGRYTCYCLIPGTCSIYIYPPQNSILIGKTITDIQIIAANTTIQDVILDTGGIITGVIKDADSKPVANILVNVCGNISRDVRSDVNGIYIIDRLSPGTYTITAKPDNEVNLLQQPSQNIIVQIGATSTQDFIFQSGGIIMGTITDELGKPIKNVQVNIGESNSNKHTKSNDNGQYIIKGLPTGMYKMWVIPDKEIPYFEKIIDGIVVVVDEITTQDVILSTGGVISGEIIDNTNNDIEKIFGVLAIPSDKKLTIDNLNSNFIHIEDVLPRAYSLSPIPPGNYNIYWYVMSEVNSYFMTFFKSSSNINIAKGTCITNHTLTLTSILGGISGTATIPESYSAPEEIFLTDLNDEIVGFAEPNDSNGRYDILYLYPGTYSIWAREPQYHDMVKIREAIIVKEGSITTANISFPISSARAGTITGLIKGIDEKPISGAIVMLTKNKYVIATTTTNDKGIFLFRNSSASSSYQLKVLKEGYIANMITPFYLSTNETKIINITIQHGDGITGVIYRYNESEFFLENKVRLILPFDNINTYEETISISRLKDTDIPPVLSSINIKPTKIAYDFKPDNLKFINPATITLYYTPEGLDEDKLAIFYYNGTKWVYVGGKVNKEEDTISFQTDHFSLYAIMEYSPLINLDRVICYPNPFYPNKDNICTIIGIPSDAQDVKVIIYNIAGELVKVFDQGEIKEGIDCKFVEWDGTNEDNYKAAYGVYIYVVKSTKGSKQGKIALIR